jgi:hypothetical protein
MLQKKDNTRNALVLAGGLAASCLAWSAPDHLGLKSADVEWEAKEGRKTVSIELRTRAPIPMDGKSGAFGYAALTDQGNNLLVLVTHLPIDDSSFERPPSGFHTHVLDLKPPTDACLGATFEVDLDSSKKNQAFDANLRWSVEGAKIQIEDVPVTDLGDAGVENTVSFTLKPVPGVGGNPTNLCVTVVENL